MLQKTVHNRHDADIVADSSQSGPQRTDAAANNVDAHPGLAGAIQSLHDDRLEQAIDLGDDPAFLTGLLQRRLPIDLFQHERL